MVFPVMSSQRQGSEISSYHTSEASSKWLEMSSVHFHECVCMKMYKYKYRHIYIHA
jgi:hypothetical protein